MEYSDLLGTPFRFGARGRDALDCWGLVMEVYRRIGVVLEDVDAYDSMPVSEDAPLFERIEGSGAWHAAAEPYEPYDVLMFADGGCGQAATHCAVYLGSGRMLHAVDVAGVIVSPVRRHKRRLIGAWRHEAVVACHV